MLISKTNNCPYCDNPMGKEEKDIEDLEDERVRHIPGHYIRPLYKSFAGTL